MDYRVSMSQRDAMDIMTVGIDLMKLSLSAPLLVQLTCLLVLMAQNVSLCLQYVMGTIIALMAQTRQRPSVPLHVQLKCLPVKMACSVFQSQ